jgi:hypothetical protein
MADREMLSIRTRVGRLERTPAPFVVVRVSRLPCGPDFQLS